MLDADSFVCVYMCFFFVFVFYMFTDQHNFLLISFFQDHGQTSTKLLMDGILNNLSGLFKSKYEVGTELQSIRYKTMIERVQELILTCLASYCTH